MADSTPLAYLGSNAVISTATFYAAALQEQLAHSQALARQVAALQEQLVHEQKAAATFILTVESFGHRDVLEDAIEAFRKEVGGGQAG